MYRVFWARDGKWYVAWVRMDGSHVSSRGVFATRAAAEAAAARANVGRMRFAERRRRRAAAEAAAARANARDEVAP